MDRDLQRQAALVLLSNPEGRVLAISRGDDVWDWGFPGGTAEPGIDQGIADTAFRELQEETGVVAAELRVLVREQCGTHFVTIFEAREIAVWPKVLRSDPFEGYVAWVKPQTLVAPTCRYRNQARKVLKKARLL